MRRTAQGAKQDKNDKRPSKGKLSHQKPVCHGEEFPAMKVCFVIIVCLFVTIVAMPLLAFWMPLDNSSRLLWWQSEVVYQIYPRSFQDSNGDGVGDLQGIRSHLDYLKWLGVGAIWLSPVYQSPMADFGYDISDHMDIDPIFGTLKDFDELIEDAHSKGIKVIMDFVPNHTSDKHRWFQESRKGGANNPYKDFYIWHEGKVLADGSRLPPNNWNSIFGGSMWEWDDVRQQFYLHQFVKQQPDLNYRNPNVRAEMEKVLTFWLERGVDGFRVDAIGTLFEAEGFPDELRSNVSHALPDQRSYLQNIYSYDLPEIHDVVKTWREVLDKHREKTGKEIFMIMEAHNDDMKKYMLYYDSGANMPFNFLFLDTNASCGGLCMRNLADSWLDKMPLGKWPNWVIGNHDMKRISTRRGLKYVNLMNMFNLLMPGTPTTYYGEELGMEDIEVSYEDTQDPYGKHYGKEHYMEVSRDPARAPMQWSSERNSGFSTAERTWLPLHPKYKEKNVQVQRTNNDSPLRFYKNLTSLRRQPAFQWGIMKYVAVDKNLFSFVRIARGALYKKYLIALNFGTESITVNFTRTESEKLIKIPKKGKLALNSFGLDREPKGTDEKRLVSLESTFLLPGQGLVFEIDIVNLKWQSEGD